MAKIKITLLILLSLLFLGIIFYFRQSNSATTFLWNLSQEGKWLLPLVAVSAVIDSVNPCAFSILLLTVAFLFSIGKLRAKILQVGGVYILGLFIAYILIGLGILQALHFFDTPRFMAKVGALLLVILGAINLINEFFPAFPIKLRIPHVAHHKMAELIEKGSLPTAFLLGGLVGVCEFPCTGGPYLMVLGLLHDQTTHLQGLVYLLLYNLIFVSPLILILLFASDRSLLARVQVWQKKERKVMRLGAGVAMILLGVVIFFL